MCDWGLRPAHKKNFRRVRRADHASLWQHASSWEWRASYDLPGAGKMVQNTICMVSPLNAPQEEQPAPGRWEDYIISQGLATTCVFSRPTMPPSATASSWEQRALHDLPGAGKWAQTTPSACSWEINNGPPLPGAGALLQGGMVSAPNMQVTTSVPRYHHLGDDTKVPSPRW
ncbi:hypothetical protein PENVUL_c001G04521 [Penicillium vulpinum]|uniref:Uncharacterized protein n=1 Tax=Penicillium vulpinum TaxID=29845 RepID=A0A1V6SEY5_9EURO|nr:hypothetical protein PENVUL_c001G04521 [Penicillium vulpinum]